MSLKTYPTLGLFKRYGWHEAVKGIKTVKSPDYVPDFYDAAKQTITDELGWRDYGGKY